MFSVVGRDLDAHANDQQVPSGRIRASTDLSQRLGVSKELNSITDILLEEERERLTALNQPQIDTVRLIYNKYSQYVSDRSSIFLVTDTDARVIALHADTELIFKAADIGLRIGSSLGEESCGTNAVPLALRHACPIAVRDSQHYCQVFRDWHCVAAPICNAEGALMGCVGLCCNGETDLGEKLAFAVLLAECIGALPAYRHVPKKHGEAESRERLSELLALTDKQLSIIDLLIAGKTYKQIGSELELSTRTIESHVGRLRKLFNAKTTAQLVALAVSGKLFHSAKAMGNALLDEAV